MNTIYMHQGFFRNTQDTEWTPMTPRRAYIDAKTDVIAVVAECERDGLGSYLWKVDRLPADDLQPLD
ncbi:MAG: hypothetical protein ISN29_02000 [Gammaproteobacteria bacterium AqS3]|nr:hypothetical protein [Gammaproteobacteria bacterium AqS3]